MDKNNKVRAIYNEQTGKIEYESIDDNSQYLYSAFKNSVWMCESMGIEMQDAIEALSKSKLISSPMDYSGTYRK